MDGIVVALTTIVCILASSYLFALSQVSFLKKNWVEYRCNPIYMPMAGFVVQDVVGNFTQCVLKGFQDYTGFIVDPIMAEFSVVGETIEEIGDTMNSMRKMFTGVRGGFLSIVGSVFGKIQNLMSQTQYIIIRMRTLMARIVATMVTFLYIFYAGMETGESVMAGPIGETIRIL
jgi:hypothetical protein